MGTPSYKFHILHGKKLRTLSHSFEYKAQMYFNREWCLVKENATREGIMGFEHFGLEQGKTKGSLM